MFSRRCLSLRGYAGTETLTVSNVLLPCGIMQQRVCKMVVKALASQNISWSGPFRWAIFTLWLWFNCMSDVFTLLLFLLYTDVCAFLPWKHEDCDSRSPCSPPPRVSFPANRTFVIEIELNFKSTLFQKNSWRRFWLFVFPQVKLLGATVEARTSTVETLLRPVMVQIRPVPASLLLLDPVSNSLSFRI